MTKIEKLLTGIQDLKAKGYDAKKIDALTEGINLIASEYRKRKARETALGEAAAFTKMDEHLKASGLSKKAFVESVGKTIIESSHSEETKMKLMENLGKYVAYMESEMGCMFYLMPIDGESKKFLASGDVNGLLNQIVLPNSSHCYRDDATAKRGLVNEFSTANKATVGDELFKVTRKLIDIDYEKLYIVVPENTSTPTEAYLLHFSVSA